MYGAYWSNAAETGDEGGFIEIDLAKIVRNQRLRRPVDVSDPESQTDAMRLRASDCEELIPVMVGQRFENQVPDPEYNTKVKSKTGQESTVFRIRRRIRIPNSANYKIFEIGLKYRIRALRISN